MLVGEGFRTAHLVDYTSVEPEVLLEAISTINTVSYWVGGVLTAKTQPIGVMQINDWIFLANIELLQHKINEVLQERTLPNVFVDISERIDQPMVFLSLLSLIVQVCKEMHLLHIKQKLRDLAQKIQETIQYSTGIMKLEFMELYPPTWSGWLLDYPCIYYDSSFEADKYVTASILSRHQNTVRKLPVHVSLDCLFSPCTSANLQVSLLEFMLILNSALEKYCAFSFSIPSSLDSCFPLDSFRQQLLQRVDSSALIKSVDIESQVVALPHVLL